MSSRSNTETSYPTDKDWNFLIGNFKLPSKTINGKCAMCAVFCDESGMQYVCVCVKTSRNRVKDLPINSTLYTAG